MPIIVSTESNCYKYRQFKSVYALFFHARFGMFIDVFSRMILRYTSILFFLWSICTYASLDFKEGDYNIQTGLLDIKNGSYIEGSIEFRGRQPYYLVDLESKSLQPLLNFSREVGQSSLPIWDKINKIQSFIIEEAFSYRDYNNPYYSRLLKQYRVLGLPVPLSEYATIKAGVCREYALFTHFALKAAGIPNQYVYAKIERKSNYYDYHVIEDHAFVVAKIKSTQWAIDSYYGGFNGFKLKDLMSTSGITPESISAPISTPIIEFRRIKKVNTYPKVYMPKCRSLF